MGFSERLRALRYRFLCMGTYKFMKGAEGPQGEGPFAYPFSWNKHRIGKSENKDGIGNG